jgi:hypothetical protein
MSINNSTQVSRLNLSNRKIEIIAIGLLIGGAIAAMLGLIIFAWRQKGFVTDMKADTSLLGNLGSFLSGTVGATWSLASVILFYLALKEQRKDIKINQDALTLQLKELEDTREVYIDQSTTFKTQGFENTFFQLLQLHSSTVKDLSYTSKWERGNMTSIGKEVFIVLKQQLDFLSEGYRPGQENDDYGYSMPNRVPYSNFEDIQITLETEYKAMYQEYENTFNHYFRQLYHIFKYVHLSELILDEKRSFYAGLIRAQLSQNELYAIMYNSLIKGYGNPNLLFLVSTYKITKNFNPNNIPNPIIWRYFEYKRDLVINPFD